MILRGQQNMLLYKSELVAGEDRGIDFSKSRGAHGKKNVVP